MEEIYNQNTEKKMANKYMSKNKSMQLGWGGGQAGDEPKELRQVLGLRLSQRYKVTNYRNYHRKFKPKNRRLSGILSQIGTTSNNISFMP